MWVCGIYVGRSGWVADGRDNRSGRDVPGGGLLDTTWSTLGRSGDTRVRVFGSHIHLASRARSGRFGDTMQWVYGAVVPCRCGLPRLGRFGDTIRRVGMGQLHRCDALATPWSVSWLACCTRVQDVPHGTLCDTMWWVCRLFVVKSGLEC